MKIRYVQRGMQKLIYKKSKYPEISKHRIKPLSTLVSYSEDTSTSGTELGTEGLLRLYEAEPESPSFKCR